MKKASFEAAMAVHIVHYIHTALSPDVRRKRAGKGGRRVRLLKDFQKLKISHVMPVMNSVSFTILRDI